MPKNNLDPDGCKMFYEAFMLYLWIEYRKGNISVRELKKIFDHP